MCGRSPLLDFEWRVSCVLPPFLPFIASAPSAFPGVRLFEDAEPMGFSRPIGAGWLSSHRSNEDVYRSQMADASAIDAPLHSLYAAGLPAGEGVCPPVATGRGFLGCPTSPHKQANEFRPP